MLHKIADFFALLAFYVIVSVMMLRGSTMDDIAE